MNDLNQSIDAIVRLALSEDIGSGDITSKAVVPAELSGSAELVAREQLVVCGHTVAKKVCTSVDARLRYSEVVAEGELAKATQRVSILEGPVQSILSAERVVLNFFQRLSGIATTTREMKNLLGDSKTELVDTRKTTPGFRMLEKYAVGVGGGVNHRIGLFDAFLIKDNHIDAMGGNISQAIEACRKLGEQFLQVEVRNQEELNQAIVANPDSILLDNMTPAEVEEAVALVRDTSADIILEISGGINRSNIASYADCGAERISSGALTHSAGSVDLALDYL